MYSREDTVADAEAGTFAWLLQNDNESHSGQDSNSDEESLASNKQDIRSHNGSQPNDDDSAYEGQGQFASDNAEPNTEDEALEPSNANEPHKGSTPHSLSIVRSVHSDFSFEEGLSSEEKQLRMDARDALLSWLALGHGVYHISGKAGAGKSTLMKFLCRHNRVRSELSHWAAQKKLVLAQFFFWSSGDQLQRSLEGLYRSILIEVLRQCPELIPEVFPDEWTRSDMRHNIVERQSLRLPELIASFNLLIQKPHYLKHRFCLFIDSLDEYEGDSVHHWELAKSIANLASSEDVKLCVSSRPHVEIMETFSDDPGHRICLHELTAPDIHRYAKAMFEKDANFERIRDKYLDLVEEIVRGSDGVFLWALLVVRSLLDGVGHHYSDAALRRRLETTPKDLSLLFGNLLARIDPCDREMADKMFLLTTFAWGKTTLGLRGPNALTYTWLDDLDDPEFPFTSPTLEYSNEEVVTRHDRIRCQLDGVTGGLLELVPAKNEAFEMIHSKSLFFKYSVQFFHRTVRDYFQEPARQIELRSRVPQFQPAKEYIRLRLAEFKFAQKHDEYLRSFNDSALFDVLFECCSTLKYEREIEQDFSFKILKGFDKALVCHRMLGKIPGILPWGVTMESSRGFLCHLIEDFSYLHFLALMGMPQYLVSEVDKSKDLLKTKGFKLNILLSAAAGFQLETVRLLLEKAGRPMKLSSRWLTEESTTLMGLCGCFSSCSLQSKFCAPHNGGKV